MEQVRIEIEASDEVARRARLRGLLTILGWFCLILSLNGLLTAFTALCFYTADDTAEHFLKFVVLAIDLGLLGFMTWGARDSYRTTVRKYKNSHGTPVYVMPAGSIQLHGRFVTEHKTETRTYEKPTLLDLSQTFSVTFPWTWGTTIDSRKFNLTTLAVKIVGSIKNANAMDYWLSQAEINKVSDLVESKVHDLGLQLMDLNNKAFAQRPESPGSNSQQTKADEMSARLKKMLGNCDIAKYLEFKQVTIARAM
jgi:hypothetical protein